MADTATVTREKREEIGVEEKYYVATQWQLIWRKFIKHKLAIIGGVIIITFYVVGVLFCEFFSTQDIYKRHSDYLFAPPQRIRFFDENGKFHFRPFVYGFTQTRDPETFELVYKVDTSKKYPIHLFIRGDPYKLWGIFPADVHLFGVKEPGIIFLFGTDKLGRDIFSRTLYAARISLSVGFVGVAMSFILGCILGGISGYYGGSVDMFVQRAIEFLISIPTIPLWMGLGAAIPSDWSPIKVYFAITVILSIVGWTGLARVVRGKLISLREEDFVLAAALAGASERRIITVHLLPAFLSYLIVHLTLAVPGMILGETALSFLGLGLRPPVVSWGVLLSEAQNVQTVYMHTWLLIPGLFVIIAVLAFNFLGDGLRDAADPYR